MFKIIFFASALLSTSAIAAGPFDDIKIASGAGVSTCALFAKLYQQNPAIEDVYFEWAQGFMSGLNAATSRMPRAIAYDLDTQGSKGTQFQRTAIRDYCDKHPLETYSDAVVDMFSQLNKVQPSAK